MEDYSVFNEVQLVSEISEGDEQAFYRLFRHYSALVRPFARRVTSSDADADEIIQETFIRIWLNREKLPEIENLRAWIFTIAANESMRYMRQRLTYEKKLDETLRRQVQGLHSEATPEQYAQLEEINRIIGQVVEAMPPQRRLIYKLSRELGLKPSAIAVELSLSVGTVKNVLSHSLKEMRTGLIKAGITLGILLFSFQ